MARSYQLEMLEQTPTPGYRLSSRFLWGAALFGTLACHASSDARADAPNELKPQKAEKARAAAPVAGEGSLGVADRGIFSDLDASVTLPAPTIRGTGLAVWDPRRALLVIYDGDDPLKAYPTAGEARVELGGETIAVRAGDAAEISALGALTLRVLGEKETMPGGDADGDGLPNRLDLLIGAQKTALNAAAYGAGYIQIDYPNGDVPRDVGVCTDVIIRAARNAGVDLQSELYEDIGRAKRSYPMVKKRNKHIDHRRVKTILPYFVRTWDQRSAALDDQSDPLEPGDIVFMDTFPNKAGPDHIGIVGTRKGESGHPVVINNWTDGSVTAEMDLLGWVPVTHRFRIK